MKDFKHFPRRVYRVVAIYRQPDGDIFYDTTINKKARVYDSLRNARIAATYYNNLEANMKAHYGFGENTEFKVVGYDLNPEEMEFL